MRYRRLILLITVIALVTFGLSVIDLMRSPEPLSLADILLDLAEKSIAVGSMGVVAWTVHQLIDLREEHLSLADSLARSAALGESWRAERSAEIAALGQAIEDQFRRWNLTAAEIDIAGLMLKGASLKDIARARATSEATIRQQAQSIYRKSGLSGRAELSAYFLESLFETADAAAQRKPALTVVAPATKQS